MNSMAYKYGKIPFIFLHRGVKPEALIMARDSHLCFRQRLVGTRKTRAGFTLVEVLMTVVIVVVAAAAAAVSTSVAVKLSNKALDSTRVDSAIDQDIASLERAAFQYTYCTGSYKWDTTSCGSAAPGTQNYYFPPTLSTTTPTNANAFAAACMNGSMTDALRAAMTGGDSSLALSAAAQNLGISRQVSLDSGSAHRLLIQYSKGGSVKRQKAIVPAAAYWCPDTEPP